MKTFILISSIFYILGLKISNKIDLIRHHSSVEKVIIQKSTNLKSEKSIDFKNAEELKPSKDSVEAGGITDKILESK